MLNDSQLITFYDDQQGFLLHFLEGQKVIHDLAILHHLKGAAFPFLRDCVLSFLPMIAFLKPSEGFGLYIDNEDPYFRFKIEANVNGNVRALLLPENLSVSPEKLKGSCRLSKIVTGGNPYTSVIKLDDLPTKELSNQILCESYQINGRILISENSDQSILLLGLPDINYDKIDSSKRLTPKEYIEKHQDLFNNILNQGHRDFELIKNEFTSKTKMQCLRKRNVQLTCPCNRERFHLSLINLSKTEDLFQEKNELIVHCDYCKKVYSFSPSDFVKN